MKDLHKVIIYRMEDVNYIGCTKQLLKRRAKAHRCSCFNPNHRQYNIPLYKHIRDNMLGIKLIPIKYLFVGNIARKMVEQYYIDKYDSINNGLNDVRAYTTRAQRKKQLRKTYQNNKEKQIKIQKKKIKCDRCGCVVRCNGIVRHYRTKKCQRLSKQYSPEI